MSETPPVHPLPDHDQNHPIPDAEEQVEEFPWPPRQHESTLSALVETWRLGTFDPARLFRALPVPGPIAPAVTYFLIIGVASAGLLLFWDAVGGILSIAGREDSPSLWSSLIGFLLSPIILLLLLATYTAVCHLSLLIVGGAKKGPATTFRVIAYSISPALFAIVPWIGSTVGSIWALIIMIVGLGEAHGTERWRSLVAVLLPMTLFFFLGMVIVLAAGVMAVVL